MATWDAWYFAYGSNLDAEQKELRTGKIREARRCRASGYRFAFNKRAKHGSVCANIVPSPGAETWGVIYRCSPEALDEMDVYEGVRGGHYIRYAIEVITEQGERLQAVTYVAGARFLTADGRPHPDYLRRILEGARANALPLEYIRSIEALGAAASTS